MFCVPMYGFHCGEFILLCVLLLFLVYFDVFDIKGAKFWIFVYFYILRLGIRFLECWAIVIYCSVPWIYILLAYIRDCLSNLQLGKGIILLIYLMVPCICGDLGLIFVYFHLLFLFIVHLLLVILFIMFCCYL
jgi:hypothetical protein